MSARPYPADEAPKSRTAVLVIDMLNFFATEGDLDYQHRFSGVVDRISDMRAIARSRGVPWIYVNTLFDSEASFASSAMARKSAPHWIKGTHEAAVVDALAPEDGDIIVAKTVNSGFFETRLDRVLREVGAGRLVLAGVHTHVCIALTAADAFYRNYDVIVVPECVTTIDLSRHEFGLGFIARHLGRVVALADIQAFLD